MVATEQQQHVGIGEALLLGGGVRGPPRGRYRLRRSPRPACARASRSCAEPRGRTVVQRTLRILQGLAVVPAIQGQIGECQLPGGTLERLARARLDHRQRRRHPLSSAT